MPLADFQWEGVSFLLGAVAPRRRPPACFLLDQQGTGKTVQASAASGLRPERALVVACPAGLRRHWRGELRRHAGRRAVVVESAAAAEDASRRVLDRHEGADALVLSHDNLADALAAGSPWLRRLLGSGVILVPDEAHRLKGRTSKRGQAARAAREVVHGGGGSTWWLTATPMPRSPLDLWVLLTWADLSRATFGTLDAFARHFGGASPDGGVTWFWSRTPPGGVATQLAGYALRRLRRDVMPELPPARVELHLVEVEGVARRTLDAVARAAAASLGVDVGALDPGRHPELAAGLAAEVGRRMGDVAEARTEVAAAKIPAMDRRIAELEAEDLSLAVYSEHRAPVDHLRGRPGWVVLTGDETDLQRQLVADSFDEGVVLKGCKQHRAGDPVWGIAYTSAGREGFSMRRADRLLVVSSPWNSDDEAQAIDRLNRYGRVVTPTVEKIVAAHPVELLTQRVLETKRNRNAVALGDDPEEAYSLSTPPPDSTLPFYSWTRVSTERDCKFAAHAKYRLRVRPAEHPEYRRLGVLFDVAVSARLVRWAEGFARDRGASGVGAEADEAAARAVREAAASHRWRQDKGSTEEDGLAALELSRRALHVFGFLSGRWSPYTYEGRPAVQVDMRVPLGLPGGATVPGFAGWRQVLDAVLWDHATPDGRPRLAVADFKCRTRAIGKTLADGQDDPQLMLYMKGAKLLGLPVEVAVRMEVLGKVPQPPRVLKGRGKSGGGLSVDKSQVTTSELFREAIRQHGLSEDDYREHLEWLAREGPKTHAIVQCGRVDGALDSVWTDMLYDAYEAQRPDRRPVRNLRPRPSAPCQSASWPCDYKELCTGTLSGFSTPEKYADTLVQIGKLRRTGDVPDLADEQEMEQEET